MKNNFCLDYTVYLKDLVILESCLRNEHEMAQSFAEYMWKGYLPLDASPEFLLVLTLSAATLKKTLDAKWDKREPISVLTLAMCCAKHFMGANAYKDYSADTGETEVPSYFFRNATTFVTCTKNGDIQDQYKTKEVVDTWGFMHNLAKEQKERETWGDIMGPDTYFQLCMQWDGKKKELQTLFTKYLIFGPRAVEHCDLKTVMLFAAWVQKTHALWKDQDLPRIISLEGVAAHSIREFYGDYEGVFRGEVRKIRCAIEHSHEIKELKRDFFYALYTKEGRQKVGIGKINWANAVNIQFNEFPAEKFCEEFKNVAKVHHESLLGIMDEVYRFSRRYDNSSLAKLRKSIPDEIVMKILMLFAKDTVKVLQSGEFFPTERALVAPRKRVGVESVVAMSTVAYETEFLDGA